ncbi:MAG: hypothetical protein IH624_08410 [Phycisphaerae bacterium]|nr:hypothetical protein [Phycisphaerae bacterium]
MMDGLGNRTGRQTLSDDTVSFSVELVTNRHTAIAGSPVTRDDVGKLRDKCRFVRSGELRGEGGEAEYGV